jgi:CubicO group peptidase (beta-lactamase class C family)
MINPSTRRFLPAVAALVCTLLTRSLAHSPVHAAEMPQVAPRDVGLSPEKLQKARSSVQAQVDKKRIAGAVVLVARHGKIAFLESFGKLDLKSGTPMRPDAIFRIYSMTKPITSVAALILVEQGKIKLDDPVGNYLPELKNLRVYAGKDQTVEAKRPVTIRDLMRHTSGFTYGMPNGSAVDRLYIKNNVGQGTLADMVKKLGTLPLQDQPGARFNYSVSTDVLGRVIEVVSGEPLDRFVRERIFVPLDMRDTGFTIADDKLDRFATAYARDSKGVLHPIDAPATSHYRKQPRFFSGGGGLVSTARDYCRLCQMLLGGGELDGVRVLRPDTVAQMTSNHLPADALPLRLGGFPLHGFGFGLGVMMKLEDKAHPTRLDGEFSWSGSASTYFWVAPKPERILIILQQLEPLDLSTQLSLKPAIDAALVD